MLRFSYDNQFLTEICLEHSFFKKKSVIEIYVTHLES